MKDYLLVALQYTPPFFFVLDWSVDGDGDIPWQAVPYSNGQAEEQIF